VPESTTRTTAATNLIRSGAIYAVANVLAAGVPFFLLPVLTRALQPEEYAVVVSFYMLVALCAGFAGLGVQSAVGVQWLSRPRGEARHATGSAIVVALVSTAIAAGVSAVVAPRWFPELSPALCATAALVAGCTTLQAMRFSVWQSCHQPLPAAALQVSSAALNIGLSLAAVLLFHMGGAGRALGAALAGMVAASVSVLLLVRADQTAGRPRAVDTQQLLRFGLPLLPHAFAGALLVNVDRLAVANSAGAAALGIYGAAAQLGMVLNVLADAAIKAYTPLFYRLLNLKTTRSKLQIVAISYVSVPVWVSVAFAIWLALQSTGSWVLGSRYLQALDLSLWFLLGGSASAVYLNVAGLFFFSGKTEWLSLATVSASALAIAAAAPLVAAHGVSGGAWAYALAQCGLLVLAWALSLRVMPLPWSSPRLALRVLSRRLNGARP
jgi:O-antigen/teichoic acid export membrane protein